MFGVSPNFVRLEINSHCLGGELIARFCVALYNRLRVWEILAVYIFCLSWYLSKRPLYLGIIHFIMEEKKGIVGGKKQKQRMHKEVYSSTAGRE